MVTSDRQAVARSLGILVKSASPLAEVPENERFAAKRILRWILQSVAVELLKENKSLAQCCKAIVPLKESERRIAGIPVKNRVKVFLNKEQKRAYYGNLIHCGLVWVDPICASRITEKKRADIAKGLEEAKKRGWSSWMITATFQHDQKDLLAILRRDFTKGMSWTRGGKGYQRFIDRLGVQGSITGTEAKVSLENGWNLHGHIGMISEAQPDQSEMDWWLKRYQGYMQDNGRYVSAQYGVSFSLQGDDLAGYLSKWGLDSELAKYPVKTSNRKNDELIHYTPFDLLAEFAMGENRSAWAAKMFQEYAAAMKGKRQLTWSRGLRSLLGLDLELTDAELAQQEERGGHEFFSLLWQQWQIVFTRMKQGQLIEVASSGDRDMVRAYLLSLGVALPNDW